MIKRRYYKQEHVERDDGSDSSSSSESDADSDSDSIDEDNTQRHEQSEKEQAEAAAEDNPISPSLGSGYESEDSSVNVFTCDSSDKDNWDTGKSRKNIEKCSTSKGQAQLAPEMRPTGVAEVFSEEDPNQAEFADYVLKCKSVFKCRICPRILCLNEEALRAHLKSKRHARSKRLLDEGRLKLMLNSDGEIEEEQETHAERHARMLALAQSKNEQTIKTEQKKKKNKGRQRQRERLKRKRARVSDVGNKDGIVQEVKGNAKESLKSTKKKQKT